MAHAPQWSGHREWIELPLSPRRRRPRLPTPLTAWWRRSALDRDLADGGDPRADSLLAYRARRLTTTRTRERIARGIESAVAEAERPWNGMRAAVPVERKTVLGARPTLLALARALRTSAPVEAQGVALALRLLTDGAGPFFGSDPRSIAEAASAAIAGLDNGRAP